MYLKPPFRKDQSNIIQLIRIFFTIQTILFGPQRYELSGFICIAGAFLCSCKNIELHLLFFLYDSQ